MVLSLGLGAMRDTGHGQHPDGIWLSTTWGRIQTPLLGGLDGAALGVPREIWPQENVANPGVKVEMNLLCFAGDLDVCRVGYRARGLMEK